MSKARAKRKGASCSCFSGSKDPMHPRPFKVVKIWDELSDTFSMTLKPEDGGPVMFAPGQFNMMYVFGVGEIPISVSGDPLNNTILTHTTRAVGKVSTALGAMKAGETIGIRGPFGSVWPLDTAEEKDLIFVSGGVGLAPLRPAIYEALANRKNFKNIAILYGARTAEDILYGEELLHWKSQFDLDVQVTVDRATGDWQGRVGFVTDLVSSGGFNPDNGVAMICGPEIMMKNVISTLYNRGMPYDNIYLSMERNMKCGVGFCGHCQWGATFVCRDGPVYRYDQVEEAFNISEL